MSFSLPSEFKVPLALIALSVIPIAGGLVRLVDMSTSADITPENARFVTAPLPIILHILSSVVFSILGAFQFSSGFRIRRPDWHRVSGRVLVPCALVVCFSGIWMTLFYPIGELLQGELLFYGRIAVSSMMVISIALAVAAIQRHDIVKHRAWMIRVYALGAGAGTQVVIFLPVMLVAGPTLGLLRDVLMMMAWLINISVAEFIISKRKVKFKNK